MYVIKLLQKWNMNIKKKIKLVSLRLQYGKQFQAERFNFRNKFNVRISKVGKLEMGSNVFSTTDVL